MVPKNGYSYYVTAEGDTIKTVKEAFGTTYDKLLNENKSISKYKSNIIIKSSHKLYY